MVDNYQMSLSVNQPDVLNTEPRFRYVIVLVLQHLCLCLCLCHLCQPRASGEVIDLQPNSTSA